jgi:uncharacterized membrane protein YidH (DUF202 family)
MALATRPKPKVSHRKRRAEHHRHSSHYLKPYWPYLPMLTIIGAGVLVNRIWVVSAAAPDQTRLQALTGSQETLAWAVIITSVAFAVFVFRHWHRVHRLINKGEALVYRNGWVDVATVFVFTAGVVLTRTGSTIIR